MGFFNNKSKVEPLINHNNQPVTNTSPPPIINSTVNELKVETIEPTPQQTYNNINTQITNLNTTKMNDSITIISAGTIIEGQMKLEGDLMVEGTIKGTVTSKSKVTIGTNGKVDGDVNCQEAEISGKVLGKLNVTDMLFLKGNALVDGDIFTGKLVMESGVKFNGKCSMGAKGNVATSASIQASTNGLASTNGTATVAKV